MAQKYYPQITRVGLSKLASASLLGQKLTLTHMALGDGENPVLDLDATALTHEVHRAAINEVVLDENVANRVNIALVIPVDVGGFTITELGVFDSDGDLIAISRFPKTYKPGLNEGSGREIRVQMKLQLSNSELIEITVDQSLVLATKQDLSDHIKDPTPHELPLDSGEAGQVLIKQADGGVAWGTIAGVPVGQLCFSTNGEALAGTIPVNVKQKVLCSAYPQLFEWMKGGEYLRTESAWDTEAAAQDGTCGKYCWDGGEWFILPCYTRYFAAAHAGKPAGSWDGDAIRNIVAGSYHEGRNDRVFTHGSTFENGAFKFTHANDNRVSVGSGAGIGALDFDASRVVPTAEENRPKTSYVLPCIKAFDVPVNAANVDMLLLAQQVAAWGPVVERVNNTFLHGGCIWFDGAVNADGRPIDAKSGQPDLNYGVCDGRTYQAPDGRHISTINAVDRFLVVSGGKYVVGDTGGAEQVTLTEDQNAPHIHVVEVRGTNSFDSTSGAHITGQDVGISGSNEGKTKSSGGGHSHENRPPYIGLFLIKRL